MRFLTIFLASVAGYFITKGIMGTEWFLINFLIGLVFLCAAFFASYEWEK